MKQHAIIAISIGDPGGVGAEVCFKALRALYVEHKGFDFVPLVIGSRAVFEHSAIRRLYADIPSELLNILDISADFREFRSDAIHLIDAFDLQDFQPGVEHAEHGLASYRYVMEALQLCLSGLGSAMVTGPISKTAFQLADIPFTGHTTLLKTKTGCSDIRMGFYSSHFSVILHSIHIPLHAVPGHLDMDSLKNTVHYAHKFAKNLGISSPKIALAGLNPHAGENGLIGSEEQEILIPLVEAMQHDGFPVHGPISPDTVFHRANQGEFDMVIALYHDQGLIPIKLLDFDSAVNVSIGLPVIRCSVDHGTAFDIAYQDKGSCKSMLAAIQLAKRFVANA